MKEHMAYVVYKGLLDEKMEMRGLPDRPQRIAAQSSPGGLHKHDVPNPH